MIPQFKPLGESITGLEIAVLAVLAVLILACVGLYCRGEYRRKKEKWLGFKEEAAKAGLDAAQADLLCEVAKTQALNNPRGLLRNLYSFDRYVGAYATALADRGGGQSSAELAAITKVRQILGFDQLKEYQAMTTTRQLQPGQRLVLWPVGHTVKNAATCTLVERDDGALLVVPVVKRDEARAATWAAGMRLEGRLNGGSRGVYRFSTLVYGRSEEGVLLRHGSGLKRSGGRKFLRWETCFELGFFAVPNELWAEREEGLDLTELPYFIATVTDVSGGGLRAEFVEQIPRGTVLVGDPDFVGPFPLGGVPCRPVAGIEVDGERPLHLKFVDLPSRRENNIVQAVNRCQLEAHPVN